MQGVRQGAIMLSAIALLACGTSSETTSPRPTLTQAELSTIGAGERVTGNATIILPNFGDALERYGVSAIRHNDGRVTGEFEETSEQEGRAADPCARGLLHRH